MPPWQVLYIIIHSNKLNNINYIWYTRKLRIAQMLACKQINLNCATQCTYIAANCNCIPMPVHNQQQKVGHLRGEEAASPTRPTQSQSTTQMWPKDSWWHSIKHAQQPYRSCYRAKCVRYIWQSLYSSLLSSPSHSPKRTPFPSCPGLFPSDPSFSAWAMAKRDNTV